MSETLNKALEKLDEKLLDWVTNGVTDTNPITGDEQTREISDKEAKVILARCKMAGIGTVNAADDDNPAAAANPMAAVMARLQDGVKNGGLRFRGLSATPPTPDDLEREVG